MPTTTTRFPLAQRMTNRSSALATPLSGVQAYPAYDSVMVNMFREEQEGKVEAVKRPGLTAFGTFTGPCQGMFRLRDLYYTINGDKIYSVFTPGTPVGVLTNPLIANVICDIVSDTLVTVASVSGLYAVIKTTFRMWLFDGTTVTEIPSSSGYPDFTVRGLVLLDGTFYVMTLEGEIRGSALENPQSWPALNFIGTDKTFGTAIGLFRHLNYVVAFTTLGTQLFFDNANPPPGSPLSPVGNANFKMGCAYADCTVFLEDLTIFLGKPQQRGRSILALQGLSLINLSNPFVDRFLDTASVDGAFAMGIKIGGHSFYILTLPNAGITLVADILSKDWYVWTSLNTSGKEVPFKQGFYLNFATGDMVQTRDVDSGQGKLSLISPFNLSDDNNTPINCRIRTNPYDGGTIAKKTFNAEYLIGDTAATTVLTRYSDDDYQTYSAFRPIDMSTVLKQIRNLGMSRRRSFEIFHNENRALRLEAVEFEVVLNN